MATAQSRVTQVVVEAVIPLISRSPATPAAAGVTQVVVEAIISRPARARATQVVVEAVVALPGGDDGSGPTPPPPGSSVHAWGSPG